jgi:hypothetical protein
MSVEVNPREMLVLADEIEVASDATPLDFLQTVYRDSRQPMQRRMKAAVECLGYVHPKLAVTVSTMDGRSLAAQMEARVRRSGRSNVIDSNSTTALDQRMPVERRAQWHCRCSDHGGPDGGRYAPFGDGSFQRPATHFLWMGWHSADGCYCCGTVLVLDWLTRALSPSIDRKVNNARLPSRPGGGI